MWCDSNNSVALIAIAAVVLLVLIWCCLCGREEDLI